MKVVRWVDGGKMIVVSLPSELRVRNLSSLSVGDIWTASSEFGTYRLCEQRRFRRASASAQSRQNSPEPSLLAHTSSESRGTFRQKARSLALLNVWACAVKICNDGMLEDTNSLDGAHIMVLLKQELTSCAPIVKLNRTSAKCRSWHEDNHLIDFGLLTIKWSPYELQLLW